MRTLHLFTRRLAYARHRFLRLSQRDIPVDASDRNVRAARSDAGAVAAVAFLVFALLEVRQIGFDSAVVAARVYVRVDIANEAQSGLSVDATSVHAAFNLADGHVAVDAVGYERHYARQLQNYALAAFRDRAERREDAAPVSLEADAKLARVVHDFDLAELQVFTLLGRADDQDLGVIGLGGLDVDPPVNAGDDNVCAGLDSITPTNLLALGEINALAAFVDDRIRLGLVRVGASGFALRFRASFGALFGIGFGVRLKVAGRDVRGSRVHVRLRLIAPAVTPADAQREDRD